MFIFPGTCSKNNPRQHNTTPGAARPPPPARRLYFQDVRKYINQFPNNSISIYNRWEEKVYEIIGYQNDWRGIGNISSNSIDLPDGVYYYILDLGNGSPLIRGFIYIKRRR